MSSYFSPEYRASYNKFLVASTASIFVSLFQVDSFSFIGLAAEKTNSQVFAFLFLIIGFWSGLSFLLIHLDERKELSKIDDQLSSFSKSIEETVSHLKSQVKHMNALYEQDTKELLRIIPFIESQLRERVNFEKKFGERISTTKPVDSSLREIQKQVLGDYKDFMELLDQELKRFKNLNESEFGLISELSSKLDNKLGKLDEVSERLVDLKSFPIWIRVRVFLMERFTPIFLFVAMIISFVFSESTFEILSRFSDYLFNLNGKSS